MLAERGVELIGPEEGELAEGETGLGRMTEPEEIFARCQVLLGVGGRLAGRRVLVSAGGTREPLDAVRFLGNRSSGRMGVAARRGGPPARRGRHAARRQPRRRRLRADIDVVQTPTAEDMRAAAEERRADADVVVMAAAVADYRPAEPIDGKRPKTRRRVERRARADGRHPPRARREPESNGQVLVGFAADTGETGLARAREKLAAKNADLIVFNDVGARGDRLRRAPTTRSCSSRAPASAPFRAPRKEAIAAAVLDAVEELLLVEAVVMAAGEGRRLRPLTERYAKPVLPIDGRPVIVTLLQELRAAGVGRITVVVGHLADQVERLLDGFPHELRFVAPARARSAPPTPSCARSSNRRTSSSAPTRASRPAPSRLRRAGARLRERARGPDAAGARRARTASRSRTGSVVRFDNDDPADLTTGAPLWLIGPSAHALPRRRPRPAVRDQGRLPARARRGRPASARSRSARPAT